MILGFKPQFKPKIQEGTKIHTIRQDPYDRWKANRIIHMATGVRTPNYDCFKQDVCTGIQFIEVLWFEGQPSVYTGDDSEVMPFFYYEESSSVPAYGHKQMIDLARNDGFESIEDFFKWFDRDFIGKIIHWTNYRYS